VENWGYRKLAYPVKKHGRGVYVYLKYVGDGVLVAELERNLRNIDEITKFLTTKVADEVDPDSRPVEPDEKRAGDVEEAAPRPERSERRDEGGFGGEGDEAAPGAEE